VALAGAGTLAKATGRGMGRPCFRVVQTHFAEGNNVGDVAAKEEVWEVVAQLLGLAASVGLLSALEAARAPAAVVPLWACIHAAHVSLRYVALSQLRFPYFNGKRGAAAVAAHVADGSVPSVEQANREEAVLTRPQAARPRCSLGCSVAEALGAEATGGGGGGGPSLAALLDTFHSERYALTWRDGAARVLLWEDAGPVDMLRALWQAAWLDAHCGDSGSAGPAQLADSLAAVQQQFPAFQAAAEQRGWLLSRTVLPVGDVRLRRE
jgi:hypothetical protein